MFLSCVVKSYTKIKGGANMKSELQKFFKSKLALSGMTFTHVISSYNQSSEVPTTISNINNKLSRETIKYSEMVKLADVMGYDIQWIKRDS